LGASIGLFSPWSWAKSEDEVPEPAVIVADLEWQLFAESNSRFLVEVSAEYDSEFQNLMAEALPCPVEPDDEWAIVLIGHVTEEPELLFTEWPPTENWHKERVLIRLPVSELKECWQRPLRW
ncbi:MAG: hypothetical protein HY000_15120, partial [Planctomycetes bacterium]|nr:hypothetical protein [Planctomycetota bacterium]